MARNFQRKDRLAALNEINVTPLLDLAFALLIIFMITTPLLEQTIQVNLPTESVKAQSSRAQQIQSITIDQSGAYFWGSQAVDAQALGDFLDLISLDPDPPVLSIRADARLPYQKVIQVVDLIKQRKLTKISLDTRAE